MKKLFLIYIFLYGLFLIDTLADSNVKDSLFLPSDSLYCLGKFRDASIEIERILFKYNDPVVRAVALLKKAQCDKQLNKFEQAQKELERVSFYKLPDTLSYNIRYQTALCAYLSDHFTDAEFWILQIYHMNHDTTIFLKETLLLEILTYNELHKWELAKGKAYLYINKFVVQKEDKKQCIDFIQTFYQNQPHLLNPQKAESMSKILPGLGQLYSHAYLQSMINFSLCLISLSFGVYEIVEGFYLTGYFVGAGTLYRFYNGGAVHTKFLAEKRNFLTSRKFNDTFKNWIFAIK